MKKEYVAPIIDLVEYSVCEAIAEENLMPDSLPFNDGDLGWT